MADSDDSRCPPARDNRVSDRRPGLKGLQASRKLASSSIWKPSGKYEDDGPEVLVLAQLSKCKVNISLIALDKVRLFYIIHCILYRLTYL